MRENLLNRKNVALFEKAGCECFSFSPDGLCTQSLKVLGKGLDESDILDAARLVSKTGVIAVLPLHGERSGRDRKDGQGRLRVSLRALYELHAPKRNLGTIVLNNIRILPGTAIEERARAQGVISSGTDLLYPTYYNPPPFESLRYRLETLHFCKNVFSWQGIR